ncbi:hypothetical protein Pcac1_g28575 [Phytophthora cactorum]|nr:hypothetical protein Pcac1_g28575 [Phytophthora cactorum]
MDKLFKCPALKAYFNKKYKRSVAQLIKQEKFCVIYATKNGIAEGVLHMKTVYAPKSDARLVKKGENVERIIMLAKSSSLDLAPPVITDEDLSFFVDKAGTRHHVEMRGMRTMEGIFFKAKDVDWCSRVMAFWTQSSANIRPTANPSTTSGSLCSIRTETAECSG